MDLREQQRRWEEEQQELWEEEQRQQREEYEARMAHENFLHRQDLEWGENDETLWYIKPDELYIKRLEGLQQTSSKEKGFIAVHEIFKDQEG